MGFLKKIKRKIAHFSFGQIRLFNVLIYERVKVYENGEQCIKSSFPFLKRQKKQPEDNVLYLKIGKWDPVTLFNLQHWVNIAHEMKAPFYIVWLPSFFFFLTIIIR